MSFHKPSLEEQNTVLSWWHFGVKAPAVDSFISSPFYRTSTSPSDSSCQMESRFVCRSRQSSAAPNRTMCNVI